MVSTISRISTATAADRLLHGALNDPSKNRALQRVRQLSPDEIFDAGFRHALNNQGMVASHATHPRYIAGWKSGYAQRLTDAAV